MDFVMDQQHSFKDLPVLDTGFQHDHEASFSPSPSPSPSCSEASVFSLCSPSSISSIQTGGTSMSSASSPSNSPRRRAFNKGLSALAYPPPFTDEQGLDESDHVASSIDESDEPRIDDFQRPFRSRSLSGDFDISQDHFRRDDLGVCSRDDEFWRRLGLIGASYQRHTQSDGTSSYKPDSETGSESSQSGEEKSLWDDDSTDRSLRYRSSSSNFTGATSDDEEDDDKDWEVSANEALPITLSPLSHLTPLADSPTDNEENVSTSVVDSSSNEFPNEDDWNSRNASPEIQASLTPRQPFAAVNPLFDGLSHLKFSDIDDLDLGSGTEAIGWGPSESHQDENDQNNWSWECWSDAASSDPLSSNWSLPDEPQGPRKKKRKEEWFTSTDHQQAPEAPSPEFQKESDWLGDFDLEKAQARYVDVADEQDQDGPTDSDNVSPIILPADPMASLDIYRRPLRSRRKHLNNSLHRYALARSPSGMERRILEVTKPRGGKAEWSKRQPWMEGGGQRWHPPSNLVPLVDDGLDFCESEEAKIDEEDEAMANPKGSSNQMRLPSATVSWMTIQHHFPKTRARWAICRSREEKVLAESRINTSTDNCDHRETDGNEEVRSTVEEVWANINSDNDLPESEV